MATLYEQYTQKMVKLADIGYATAVLHWDKETYLPKKGATHRSQQLATLSAIMHQEFTDPKFGSLLKRLSETKSLSTLEAKNVRLTLKDYDKATKFTEEQVRKKSMAVSTAFHAWIKAREANDYDLYEKPLQQLIEIIREECEIIGYEDHPYDACLDIYEPGLKVKFLNSFFKGVKSDLAPLIERLREASPIRTNHLYRHYPKDDQWDFGIEVLTNMGFDFEAGRQDISEHPFTINFSPQDVRVTTRIDENDFLNMTWSCIHEGGHALYEQGLPMDQYGLPSGSAISLAIHESQSRLWENNVGRSMDYWEYLFPILTKRFPHQMKGVTIKKFYKSINTIKPNLIRTEADELHYHLHVLIRYEIEKDILSGKLNADQLKQSWNARYKKYMGIVAEDDVNGILQDVHWAHGSFGYFPTYSLGSFYAAQFYNAANKDIPNLPELLQKGNTKRLLKWLRENIHEHGRKYEADELCKLITGEGLNTKYFIEYATRKFEEVYGITS